MIQGTDEMRGKWGYISTHERVKNIHHASNTALTLEQDYGESLGVLVKMPHWGGLTST